MCWHHCTSNDTKYMTTPNGKTQYFFPIEQWHRYRWNIWHHLPENAKRSRSLCRLRIRWFGDDVFPPAPAWRIISAIYTFHCHGYKRECDHATLFKISWDKIMWETKSCEWQNLWSEARGVFRILLLTNYCLPTIFQISYIHVSKFVFLMEHLQGKICLDCLIDRANKTCQICVQQQ